MSFLTTALGPSPELFRNGAILVNRNGQRYVDELANPSHAVPHQPEKVTYIVFDRKLAERFTAWPYYVSTAPGIAYAYLADYRRNRADIYHEASTVEGLARSMGVPPDALARTLSEYNASGRGDRPALDAAPYFALGPVKSYVVFTDGGLKVTERLEVTREDGTVIPGLYAAGSTGQGGLLLEGHGHHLGWAFISGRIAGTQCRLRRDTKCVNGDGNGDRTVLYALHHRSLITHHALEESMIFISQSGLTDPGRAAEWDAWYIEHLQVMLSVPAVSTAQRFFTDSPGYSPSLAMYTVPGPEMFSDPYYLSVRGMGEWSEFIDKRYYHRNLFAGLDRAPRVTASQRLIVADRSREDAGLGGLGLVVVEVRRHGPLDAAARDRRPGRGGGRSAARARPRRLPAGDGADGFRRSLAWPNE